MGRGEKLEWKPFRLIRQMDAVSRKRGWVQMGPRTGHLFRQVGRQNVWTQGQVG